MSGIPTLIYKDEVVNERFHDLLIYGAIRRTLVPVTDEHDRCTGKTTTLIMFAKKYGFAAIVEERENIEYLRERFDYNHIYTSSDMILGDLDIKKIVIDETISEDEVPEIYEVITGFKSIQKIKEHDCLIDFIDDCVNELNAELEQNLRLLKDLKFEKLMECKTLLDIMKANDDK
ncbi:hypothetical protein [Metabacillus sp. 22489]|uniref:hypothetical protein n=1 Tax=Metabacillus sp. 22489 TaxID=3453928 RepID=UPI003F83DF1D